MYMPNLIIWRMKMLEIICYIFIFIIGTFFGSFFTLAVYRIPLGKDITHEHSFCPTCEHKLGIIDLIPVFSYLFLGGKCRYCGEKIKIRYLCLEVLSGITFVLLAWAFHFDFNNLEVAKYTYFFFIILYFCSLFIMAGIDKERRTIQRAVLLYGFLVEAFYMVYLCIVDSNIIYRYIIYLFVMLVFVILDTILIKKKANSKYSLQILILSLYMLIFTGEYAFILTICCTVIAICLYEIMKKVDARLKKGRITDTKEQVPVGFYLTVSNIIFTILTIGIINFG